LTSSQPIRIPSEFSPRRQLNIKKLSVLFVFIFCLAVVLSACGGKIPVPAVNGTAHTTLPAVNNGEGSGEAGGVEAALVTYSDATQGFAISHPGPWTQDTSFTNGVKYAGGDDWMTVEFVTPTAGTNTMTYAQNDVAAVTAAFPVL
jgi:hypothetical protein